MFCPHNAKAHKEGMCSACANLKTYLQFRYCKKQCFACNECGYFWGPGQREELAGRPVKFGDDRYDRSRID